MKDNETARDRLVDSLLREDANGGADEALLAELEERIDAAEEGVGEETRSTRGSSRWLWGLGAAACVGLLAGYAFFYGNQFQPHGHEDVALQAPSSQAGPQPVADRSVPEGELTGGRADPGSEVADRRPDAGAVLVNRTPPDASGEGGTSPVGTENGRPSIARIIGSTVPNPTAGPRPAGLSRDNRPVVGNRDDFGDGWGSGRNGGGGSVFGRPIPAEPPAGGTKPGHGHPGGPPTATPDRERYGQLVDQPWKSPWQAPLSTFSVDVDTASYSNIRRLLKSGATIPKDAVRLEEFINYFDYNYPTPKNGGPFAVHVESATCPWEASHHLVKIGLKGKEVDTNTRPPSNLIFLIDVSGSMKAPNKLPLLVESMKILVEELDERDSVGIVVYASGAGTVLEPTKVVGQGRTEILSALDNLRAGGSTAGAAGIRGAYELAARHYQKDGVNRVLLATDGDFNVGTSSDGELVDLVKEKAKAGIHLSVLGFGHGNLNDSMLEAITNDGNGNYFYIDTEREGRKVFLQDLSGTLVTIAKDVKIQVEFNPGKVAAYRLIGYANRILRDEDFNNDAVDAGDIGAGHTVTALYEIVPVGVEVPAVGGVDPLKYQKPQNRAAVDSPEWMTVKLRYKAPDGDKSSLIALPVSDDPVEWTRASADFQFAAGVALFGEKLRGSDKIGETGWEMVADLAQRGRANDPHGHRGEFRELVDLARGHERPAPAPHPVPAPGALEAPPAE